MAKKNQRSLYALLEVDPGATDDEIRRAYKRLTQLFDPEGLVVYGLYSAAEAQRLMERLRTAYNTLLDPDERRAYDRQIYPQGHPSLRRADQRVATSAPVVRAEMPADPLAALDLPPDVRVTGDVLSRVRQVCHVTLEDIAERTKISMFALRCIEADEYGDLPAPVYLRGFIKQVADMLRLDADRVVEDYMAGYDAWKAEKDRKKPW